MSEGEGQDPFASGRPVLLDGGVGSELRRRGAGADPESWLGHAIVAAPELLEAVHADYTAAGSTWATAATFSATPLRLSNDASWRRCVDLAVGAARRGGPGRVAGALSTVPPSFDAGRWPGGDVERAAFDELVAALLAAGIDALALEMIQDSEHGGAALEAAAAGTRAAGIPLWLGVCARRTSKGLGCFDFPERDFSRVLAELLARQRPDAVVLMHTPLDAVLPALAAIRAHWDGPLAVRPELPYPEDGTSTEPTAPGILADALAGWPVADLAAVGGCCGTRPDQIAALAAGLDRARATALVKRRGSV
ncbi:MAG: homocysteine S-methyltransferase family protein [Pseudomonadales bacterium]|jgi:homocysteine S-methyltransferase|nr:homocysteine S-methyltransferase family protein [Pseudomonadales bacterium]